ncbi:mRNA decapping enzyme [Coprinopsis marcescibilis]|uniref:mRNA decapping enzyme n=1 Tax=Coprinopsis marcescibilis TaxID=230819 RepID=A0A5C3L3N1_COPMA|nr:mRNA decapping enzyme [Coprinopsis marcescibilis]
MSHPFALAGLSDLQTFEFQKVINEDPASHALTLLGTLKTAQAIIRIEKTALNASDGQRFFGDDGLVQQVQREESTDIYSWFFAWLAEDRERDLKVSVICPATETHVRKYTRQEQVLIRETPTLYEHVVKSYIAEFPLSRTQWVENILNGLSEQSKILYSNPQFLILPDMKWDLKTVSSLYLVTLVQDRSIKSLRDLRGHHIDLLKAIRDQAERIVLERWNLAKGTLRMYIHYQPSYYHFHVHIVNVNYLPGGLGMTVGQAHLLDDVISLLELDSNVFQRMTLSYSLGDQSDLLRRIRESEL